MATPPRFDLEAETLLDREAAGRLLGKAAQTLARWKSEGIGPRYFKLNGRALYRVGDLIAYRDQFAVQPPHQSRAAAMAAA